jgi:AAA+ ATPase superfamily predicted ATPase
MTFYNRADEFPYLAEADPATETVMQKWWDSTRRATPNLKVFLAGSHVSWMREHTLSEHGPLQNRRTRQIEVSPLDYRHAAEFYPDWSSQDKIRAYAIWGDLPGYMHEINPALGLWDNVSQTLLDPTELLLLVNPVLSLLEYPYPHNCFSDESRIHRENEY